MPWSHQSVSWLIHFLGSTLPVLCKCGKGQPKALGPWICVVGPETSRLLLGPAPSLATLWEWEQLENLCIPLFLYIGFSKTNIYVYVCEFALFIVDDVYINDQGRKVQGLRKNWCDHCFQIFYFFFKDLFIYWKVRYTERRRDREEDLPSDDLLNKWAQRPMLCQSEARMQELLPGLAHGEGLCRVPKLWAVLNCSPRPQAWSWMGSGAAGIRTGAQYGFLVHSSWGL